jgi:prophage maintenance system killer protein
MSIATQLDASGGRKSSKRMASYREEVTTLNVFCVKSGQALATLQQTPWPFEALNKSAEARQSAERRAQHLNYVMMTWLSLAAAIFLVLVLRSHALPDWAKQIAIMAAGAIIAGRFPL